MPSHGIKASHTKSGQRCVVLRDLAKDVKMLVGGLYVDQRSYYSQSELLGGLACPVGARSSNARGLVSTATQHRAPASG